MPLHILLISTDQAFTHSITDLLADDGHTVVSLPPAGRHFKIDTPAPDVIVCDLPGDGGQVIETVTRLQKGRETRHVPIIAVSSFPEYEFELHQTFDFLTKPVDFLRLRGDLATIERGARQMAPQVEEDFSDEAFRLFVDYLVTHSGLRFERRNARFLARGIIARMNVLQSGSYRDYYNYLSRYGETRQELQKLLQLLTVGETYFFRYRAHFEVLGRLLKKEFVGAPEKKLRIWSAGCSTGEEPYSIAMTIMDLFPDWRSRDIEILATDINRRALKKAAEGIYRPWAMRATDQRHQKRYFDQQDDHYRIKDDVKRLVRLFPLNLQTGPYPSKNEGLAEVDIIFCRNVLIYFDLESMRRVVENFAETLHPGGYLFLGHAETLAFLSSRFERHSSGGGFYYRKRGMPQAAEVKERRPVRERRSISPVPLLPLQRSTVIQREVPPALLQPAEPDLEALYTQARRLFDEENFTAAGLLVERILEKAPREPRALVLRGFVLANRGQTEESLEVCRKVQALDDLLPDGYLLRGLLFEMLDKPEEAMAEYRKAILLAGDFMMPHYCLGRLLLRLGRKKDGMRELRNCCTILERSADDGAVPYAGGASRGVLLAKLRQELAVEER
ncbi:CheR family methyltransferase [Geobacter sp. DSM 9736]|uniref:CheR family methyltransferase n=1 Tax=Geobacter sp. DSM 9736 TaxID=1277350 RepID=UPI000B50D50C|nr:CheR family methyltransferase [Geobacter sp. DSM 9736]SNB47681.1 chemotaxis protein methyltransferase CheR [Geobacter sp. DSM 9736]